MKQESAPDLHQLVSFKVGNDYFGIDVVNVTAIINAVQIISINHPSEYVEEAITLLEELIPIFNFRAKLNLTVKEYNNDSKIIVLNYNNDTFGFIVDEISETLRIPVSTVDQTQHIIEGLDPKFIMATGKFENRSFYLLNMDEILSGEVLTI
jgi:purine-binding chemotaxis protein CheW